MSMSKRILFGNDPADDEARRQLTEKTRHDLEAFKFKIPRRQRNRVSAAPYWDPFWAASRDRAAKELDVKTVLINDQMCARSLSDLTLRSLISLGF